MAASQREHAKLVVELKADGSWEFLSECFVNLICAKPFLLNSIKLIMSFHHELVCRVKWKLQDANFTSLPLFLGLTCITVHEYCAQWDIKSDRSIQKAMGFVQDFDLDGLYIQYQDFFHEPEERNKLQELLAFTKLGLWNGTDTPEELSKWVEFGFAFVNTDLTTHFMPKKVIA